MKLRPSQQTAVRVLSQESRLLLADVGSGKTATALSILRRRNVINPAARTLVLGTKRICSMVWPAEVRKWAPEFGCASVAGLSAAKRKALMESNVEIICLNYDNLLWAIETYGEQLPVMFPQLIIDESSKLENPKAKGARALKDLLPRFTWRLPMTGTPRANHLEDLWGNVLLADLGATLGEYRAMFMQRFFYPTQGSWGVKYVPNYGAEGEIYNACAPSIYRMVYDGDKPEVVEIDITLPLNDAVAKVQDFIERALQEEQDPVFHEGITWASGGYRSFTKQLQLSSGLVYMDSGEIRQYHTDKLDALREIVEEAHGAPIMVVYAYEHERDAILNEFPQARVLNDSEHTLTSWNNGEIEMLLLHPLSAGHGLNAQFGGSVMVWYTPTPDAELYKQTVGRLARSGQRAPLVKVFRLIMEGTQDARCYAVVLGRDQDEQKALDHFRQE